MDDQTNITLINVFCGISIFLSFFFILILKKKESNYARIVRHIVMTEGMYIFSFMEIILRGKDTYLNQLKDFSRKSFEILTFKLFDFKKEKETEIYYNEKIDTLNLALYFSMEAFSLLFSIFICMEMILILRNPIAQMKSRFKPYFVFALFVSLAIFVMICTVDFPEETKNYSVEEYFFYQIFQM